MPKPGEHKTVQARILRYAQEIGWTFVPRADADARRGVQGRGKPTSLFFNDLLYRKVKEFNPFYNDPPGALVSRLHRLQANIHGNRQSLDYLRNRGKAFVPAENRERDLTLID